MQRNAKNRDPDVGPFWFAEETLGSFCVNPGVSVTDASTAAGRALFMLCAIHTDQPELRLLLAILRYVPIVKTECKKSLFLH